MKWIGPRSRPKQRSRDKVEEDLREHGATAGGRKLRTKMNGAILHLQFYKNIKGLSSLQPDKSTSVLISHVEGGSQYSSHAL